MPGNDDIIGKMGLDVSNLEKQIGVAISALEKLNKTAASTDKAAKSIEKSAGVAANAMRGLGKVAGAFGISLGLTAVVAFGKSLLDFGKKVSDAGKVSEMSTDDFQRMSATLQKFVSAEDAGAAIKTLADTLREAREGSVDAIEKLEALGVSMDKIADPATNAKTLMEDIADGYANASDKSEYLQRITEVFGADLARKLVPALQEGGQALKSYSESVAIATQDTIDMATEGARALDKFGEDIKRFCLSAIGNYGKFLDKTMEVFRAYKMFGKFSTPDLSPESIAAGEKNNAKMLAAEKASGINTTTPTPTTADKPGSGAPATGSGGGSSGGDSGGSGGRGAPLRTPTQAARNFKQAVRDIIPAMRDLAEAESKRTLGLKYQLDAMEAQRRVLKDQILMAEHLGKKNEAAALKSKRDELTLSGLEMRAKQHDMSPRERAKQFNEQRAHERSIRAQAKREMEKEKSAERGAYNYKSSDYLRPSKATEDTITSYLQNGDKARAEQKIGTMTVTTFKADNFEVPNK